MTDNGQRRLVEVEGWLELGCPERALIKLQDLLDSPVTRKLALELQVRALLELRRHDQVLEVLPEMQKNGTDHEWVNLTAAWCHKRLDNLAAAIDHMEQLLDRNHRSAIGHFNLGCYLALNDQTERAIDELSIACGIDEQFRRMLNDESDLDSLRNEPRFLGLLPP